MPSYEYRCRNCGEHFEIFAPINAKPEHPACSRCGGTNTQAVYTSVVIGGRNGGGETLSSGRCATCGGGSCSSCH